MNRNYPFLPGVNGSANVQPETQAIINWVEDKHFVMSANFHGGAELTNFPWDSWDSRNRTHADDAWFRYICQNYVDTCHNYDASYMVGEEPNNSGCGPVTEGGDWYVITGSRQDYMNYYHGIREMTMEVSSDKKLASEMLANGGLLTECMSGTLPDRENFPRRNRIIAGMADAVVVVESALKGGSLITADLANSYNREVFAFPGRVDDLYSQGCNYLIRTNRANLIESVANLRYVMRWDRQPKEERQTTIFREFTSEEKRIIDCFGSQNTISLDDLIVNTQLPTTKLASLLLNLEFDGIVMSLPGKRYQRC